MESNFDTEMTGDFAALGMGAQIIIAAFSILYLIVFWKLLSKAGLPGWGILIPIYNAYLMIKLAGKPGWWLVLLFVPIVNIVISIMLPFATAKCFGKGAGFGIGLLLLGFIFYPILAFGAAEYVGPAE